MAENEEVFTAERKEDEMAKNDEWEKEEMGG